MTTRWVFKVKTGNIAKCRLVVRGFEEPDLNKGNTYSPTPSATVLRIALTIAASRGYQTVHIDFTAAFLNSEITENEHLYVHPPAGVSNPGYVFKLQKSLYGLSSSPLRWFNTITRYLLSYGLTQHPTESCLFYGADIILVLYVDDLKVAAPKAKLDHFAAFLNTQAKCTVNTDGEYLSMAFSHVGTSIKVSQARYAQDLLKDLGCDSLVPKIQPFPPGLSLIKGIDVDSLDDSQAGYYRTALGKIGYLLMTRPELGIAYSELSRFSHSPETSHLEALHHVLGFIKRDPQASFTIFPTTAKVKLTAFSDSDFANNIDDRKSVSGRIIFAGRTPILWKASRQTLVSTSSSQAELYALYEAALDLVYLRSVLAEMSLLDSGPSTLYCDNETAIYSVMEGSRMETRQLSKHASVKLLKLRELIDFGHIRLDRVSTTDNVADIMTKALTAPSLRVHLNNLRSGNVFGLNAL
jgi:hypothetical protein